MNTRARKRYLLLALKSLTNTFPFYSNCSFHYLTRVRRKKYRFPKLKIIEGKSFSVTRRTQAMWDLAGVCFCPGRRRNGVSMLSTGREVYASQDGKED